MTTAHEKLIFFWQTDVINTMFQSVTELWQTGRDLS